MKVYIGPYPKHYVAFRYYDEDEHPQWMNRWVNRIETVVQWVYDKTVNAYYENKQQTIKVIIDNYDTWNVDFTLAHIIYPLLKRLDMDKNGSPQVDDEDIPDTVDLSKYMDEDDSDDAEYAKIHAKWNWVINEMIFAFEMITKEWPVGYLAENDIEFGSETANELTARVDRGLMLFGKYYQALWT